MSRTKRYDKEFGHKKKRKNWEDDPDYDENNGNELYTKNKSSKSKKGQTHYETGNKRRGRG